MIDEAYARWHRGRRAPATRTSSVAASPHFPTDLTAAAAGPGPGPARRHPGRSPGKTPWPRRRAPARRRRRRAAHPTARRPAPPPRRPGHGAAAPAGRREHRSLDHAVPRPSSRPRTTARPRRTRRPTRGVRADTAPVRADPPADADRRRRGDAAGVAAIDREDRRAAGEPPRRSPRTARSTTCASSAAQRSATHREPAGRRPGRACPSRPGPTRARPLGPRRQKRDGGRRRIDGRADGADATALQAVADDDPAARAGAHLVQLREAGETPRRRDQPDPARACATRPRAGPPGAAGWRMRRPATRRCGPRATGWMAKVASTYDAAGRRARRRSTGCSRRHR